MSHTASMQEPIRLLLHQHYKVERSIRRQQRSRQISYETYFYLMTLKNYGQVKVGKLAEVMHLNKQQAVHVVDSLHRYDLMERSKNSDGWRSIYIGTTTQGFHFLEENVLDVTALYERVLQKLSNREIAAFERVIHTMLRIPTKLDQQVSTECKQLQCSITIQNRSRLLCETIPKWGKETDHRYKPSFASFRMS